MQRPQITIRFGAASDDISVDGHTFTRNQLPTEKQEFLRDGVVQGIFDKDELQKDRWWRKRKYIRQAQAERAANKRQQNKNRKGAAK